MHLSFRQAHLAAARSPFGGSSYSRNLWLHEARQHQYTTGFLHPITRDAVHSLDRGAWLVQLAGDKQTSTPESSAS